MLKSVSEALLHLRDGLDKAYTKKITKTAYWQLVRFNVVEINSLIDKTAEIDMRERFFVDAAKRYTGGFDISATLFASQTQEEATFQATVTALAMYRNSLKDAELSEEAKILRLDDGEKI
jgi:hypothetical protein